MTYPPPPSSGDQPPWPSGGQPQGSGMPPPPAAGQPVWRGTQPMPYQPQGGGTPGYQAPWPGSSGPGTSGPKPPGSGSTAKWVLGGLAGGVVLVLIIALIGTAVRGQPAPSTGSPGTGSTAAGSVPASVPASGASSDSAESPAPSGASSGPVGTTYRVVGFDHSQNPTTYDVTLLAVSQSAAPADSFNAPKSGDHLAWAKIKVTGVTGHAQDDANLDAVAHGSDSQVYQPSFDTVAAGTNFSSGDFDLQPGQSVIGFVSYEMPNSAKITSVTWDSNLQGKIVTWTI